MSAFSFTFYNFQLSWSLWLNATFCLTSAHRYNRKHIYAAVFIYLLYIQMYTRPQGLTVAHQAIGWPFSHLAISPMVIYRHCVGTVTLTQFCCAVMLAQVSSYIHICLYVLCNICVRSCVYVYEDLQFHNQSGSEPLMTIVNINGHPIAFYCHPHT